MKRLILLALMLCFAVPARAEEPAALRIVCLGDSITQGRGDHSGGGATWTPTFSYRYPLWKLLVDAGVKADFVGSLQAGFEGSPDWADYQGHPFDRDHEGHWGWTTVDVATKLPGWLAGYTPDVALVLLGGNDVSGESPEDHRASIERVRNAMIDIFATLRKKNPNVAILLGQCYQEWAPFPAMRTAMTELAKTQSTAESPIVIVDHSAGWVSDPEQEDTCTVDWVHPNPVGDAKLASNWLAALKPFLPRIKATPDTSAVKPKPTAEAAAFPPAAFPDASDWGKNIQRTMRLLATSTAEKRNTVRILFYGQSITEQKWAQLVEDDLRRRFPHANLLVENRALGGFASQMLVKTAETDLYSFQPDLLIFHVYGAHDKYEDIIRRTREQTTAEILIQNDHVTKPADFNEETDPAKASIQSGNWDAFMNHNWLPSLAKKYKAELCDQRALWKGYLTQNHLEPSALLRESVHLNAHGEWFMAECVKAYLRYVPTLGPSPAEDWVTTYEVGKDVRWTNGKLQLDFTGSRVEAICKSGSAAPAAVRINGRKPSEFAELYGFTRAVTKPQGKWPVKWPVIAPITSKQPLLVEDWTLEANQDAANKKLSNFILTGSKTGPDGEGRSDAKFVSNSGRVIIASEDWNVDYAMSLAGIKPMPEQFAVKWKVQPHFVDEFVLPEAKDAKTESTVTLAEGLPNTKHTLEISGGPDQPITAVRIYQPPLGRK